jgi:FHS family L-fucose permease-like MFS transporter
MRLGAHMTVERKFRMAMPVRSTTLAEAPDAAARPYGAALALLASLFFMWGFITVLNDILIPHLKAVFDLNYTQSLLIQFVWFIAYGVASFPAAKLIERIGYKRSMVVGLGIMALGALGFLPAAQFASYGVFLAALFVLACGITLLQVAANPYVAVIGPARTASFRLNLVQAFNSLGTFVAPTFGALLILGRSTSGTVAAGTALTSAQRLADAQSVQAPYVLIAIVLVVIAVVIGLFKLPDLGAATQRTDAAERRGQSLLAHRNLVFGVPAIAFYVLAEICVGSLLISYIQQPDIAGLSAEAASRYLTFLWGGMMVGRFIGAFVMRVIAPERLLAFNAAVALVLVLYGVVGHGHAAMYALVAVGLFHSIMFPTIFTLGIKGLGPLTEEGSGLLIMAIAGGALATGQAWIADHYGLHISFLVPAACELYVLFYALWGCKPTGAATMGETFN